MRILQITGFGSLRTALANMQWRRGLRAGLAVGVAMLVCLLLDHPMGWAALGGLQVVLVDNGGPYRSRLANALTVLAGGSLAVALGVLAGVNLPTALAVTIFFCFTATLARVLSQPLASSSVIILVSYIVAYGSPLHTLAYCLHSTTDFILGGIWAATLTLILWPADPFRPARNALADVFAVLAELVHLLPTAHTHEGNRRFNELLARFRTQIEAAHQTLAATPARMTARTIRARNLAVLTESADLLLARILRLAELGHNAAPTANSPLEAGDVVRGNLFIVPKHLAQIAAWLSASLDPIEPALRQRPAHGESAFAPYGSRSVELRRALAHLESTIAKDPALDIGGHLTAALRDTLLNLEVSYEAILAIWSGVEPRRREAAAFPEPASNLAAAKQPSSPMLWLDLLRANLTLNSVMFRHALRLSAVVAIDVLLIHFIRITHGYWLAMTSIIVLQPYTGETVRRSGERVAGTVAGAVLAALLAASIHTEAGILAVVSIGATFAVALYTVDYAWYCFFLTPTIVLMTLPHLRDWHFAAVRMGMTGLGALVAVLAMVLLWPERESLQLPGLLARGAAADAAYLRAMLAYWEATANALPAQRLHAERSLLAPARRLCGLAINDAEETLDHALLEHALPLNPARISTGHLNRAALTFTTYLRRLTQTITTLAAIGDSPDSIAALITSFSLRLDTVSAKVLHRQPVPTPFPALSLQNPTQQLRRLERQVSVLETTANDLASTPLE